MALFCLSASAQAAPRPPQLTPAKRVLGKAGKFVGIAAIALGAGLVGSHLVASHHEAPAKATTTQPAPASTHFAPALESSKVVYLKDGETVPEKASGVKYVFPPRFNLYVIPLKDGSSVTAVAQEGKLVSFGDHQPLYKLDKSGHSVQMTLDDIKK